MIINIKIVQKYNKNNSQKNVLFNKVVINNLIFLAIDNSLVVGLFVSHLW